MKNSRLFNVSCCVLLICLVVLCSVAGCTKSDDERTTIHFVTWQPNVQEGWDEILELFEEEYPDIKVVTALVQHSSTVFYDFLTQKLKNKSTDVDVFLMDVIWPQEFGAEGWAMPLDDLFTESEKEQFLGGTVLANSYKGKTYGIPLFIDSGMLYYRKDLLDKYKLATPKTWDEMVMQADIITTNEMRQDDTELYGFSGQFDQYEGLVCDMMEYILSNGGYILNADTGKSGLTEKPAIDAVRFVRNKIIGRTAPKGALKYQEPESLDLFIQGKAVFHRNWSYAWRVANDQEKSKISGKVGISVLPHFEGNGSYAALGGWQVGVSRYSANKDAARTFATFLASSRAQKILALKTGRAPSRKGLYEDEDVLQANPHFHEMKDAFITAYPRPGTPFYPAVSSVLQKYFSKAISGSRINLKRAGRSAAKKIEKLIAVDKR